MKPLFLCISAILLAGPLSSARAQIRDNESSRAILAIHCAASSGFSAEDFEDYSRRLAKTIGMLNPQQQTRVFGFLPNPGGGGAGSDSGASSPAGVAGSGAGAAPASAAGTSNSGGQNTDGSKPVGADYSEPPSNVKAPNGAALDSLLRSADGSLSPAELDEILRSSGISLNLEAFIQEDELGVQTDAQVFDNSLAAGAKATWGDFVSWFRNQIQQRQQ